ncbi:UDP-glucose/GDP-mannose dehydrogenase family protein [Streptomyces sp. R302]|uniref:UDP-glucose dehydrogenase family protein n=1 Tax=unclassified Streptomyces TaxID=2593676 RepID=UPI00145CD8FB|nr:MULTISPECIES: UDP-glucose/GDP-mannose dehydrogenase family protein [unclassified Streptomyces]NML55152.1 UDP-glucose/GDP-mannose dehydrogenase family protein [Streptomyces sp. R301]NML83818.1 UDP-glucose/GDP-mannose dehydrogenase family protein [Streptomyces sp. R302]
MRVSVIGCGHLGIPHAAAMAHLGHQVIGVDTDSGKVSALNAGEAPIYETGLLELLAKYTSSGDLRFTLSLQEAAEFADVHFLAVGTPIDSDGRSYDTGQVFGAVRELAPYLTRPCTIMGKSTVTVGTTKRLTELVHRLAPAGDAVDVVWNPEFLREGHAIDDTLRPDRIIAGLTSKRAEQTVREVYKSIIDSGVPLFVMTPETAELTKGAANTFLGLKISYINAVADMCAAAGADVAQLVEALGIDARIGHGGMKPGIGYGGGCLPKDVRAFTASAGQLGVDHAETLLLAAEAVNDRRPEHAVQLIDAALDRELSGARVAMLGASFKAGTNDVRESPALSVASRLHKHGARVTVHDPVALPTAARRHPELEYADSVAEAVIDADVVVVGTEWPEYQEINPEALAGLAAKLTVVDFRNILDGDRWAAAGWSVHWIGRPSTIPTGRDA